MYKVIPSNVLIQKYKFLFKRNWHQQKAAESNGSLTEYKKITYINSMYAIMNRFGIDDRKSQLFFLAQAAHETQAFARYSENLNYSARGLLDTFPRHYLTINDAKEDERKPKIIANRVYANRYGNGDFDSGDGYKYSGKGFFMLTFKDNYKNLDGKNEKISANYFEEPESLLDFIPAVESACDFWERNKMGESAKRNDFRENTKILNGGMNGFDDRMNHLSRLSSIAN